MMMVRQSARAPHPLCGNDVAYDTFIVISNGATRASPRDATRSLGPANLGGQALVGQPGPACPAYHAWCLSCLVPARLLNTLALAARFISCFFINNGFDIQTKEGI